MCLESTAEVDNTEENTSEEKPPYHPQLLKCLKVYLNSFVHPFRHSARYL